MNSAPLALTRLEPGQRAVIHIGALVPATIVGGGVAVLGAIAGERLGLPSWPGIAVGALLAANLFVGLNTFAWTWMVYVAVIGSSASVWLWVAIYSAYPGTTFSGTLVAIFTTAECWLVIVLVQVVCLGPRFVWK